MGRATRRPNASSYRGGQRVGFGVWEEYRECLPFGRRTDAWSDASGSCFLGDEGSTDGGHEHGLVALWEAPIVGVGHSSNK